MDKDAGTLILCIGIVYVRFVIMSDTQRQLRGIRGKRNTRKKRKRSGGTRGDGPGNGGRRTGQDPDNEISIRADPVPTNTPIARVIPTRGVPIARVIPTSEEPIRAMNVAPLTQEQYADIQGYESHVNNAISPYRSNPTQILSDAKTQYINYVKQLSDADQKNLVFGMKDTFGDEKKVKQKIRLILSKILEEIKKNDTRDLLVHLFRMSFIHPVRFLYAFVLQLLKQNSQGDGDDIATDTNSKLIEIPEEGSVFFKIIEILTKVLTKYEDVVKIIIRAAEDTKSFGMENVVSSQPFLLLLLERSFYGLVNNVIDCNMLYYSEVLKILDGVLKESMTDIYRKILLHYLLSFKTYIKTIQTNPEYRHTYKTYYQDKYTNTKYNIRPNKDSLILDKILFQCMTIINEAIEKKNENDTTICVKTDVFLGRTFLDETITNIYDSVNFFSTSSKVNYPYLVKLSSVVDYFIRRLWKSIVSKDMDLLTEIKKYKMRTQPPATYITFGTRNLILFADKPRQFLTYFALDIKRLLDAIQNSDEQNTNTEDAGLLAMKEASAELTMFRTLFESESPDAFVKRYFTDIVHMVGGYCKSREDIIERPKTITSYITIPSMPISNISLFNTSESKKQTPENQKPETESKEQPSKKKNTKPESKKPTSKKNIKPKNPKGGNRITRKILISRS